MSIKAVGFDVGHTLVQYKNPLNWKSLYTPALRKVESECKLNLTDSQLQDAIKILLKYNTRENYRENEVDSNIIFKEIFTSWDIRQNDYSDAKQVFYSFFQADAVCFEEVVYTLKSLKDMDMKMAILTDVAYGMDNRYSLKDIESIIEYFDICFTSVDVGYRKPNKAGYEAILKSFNVLPSQMIFVGDEEKDIIGANSLGIISVLINRTSTQIDWNQTYTISSLVELWPIIKELNKVG